MLAENAALEDFGLFHCLPLFSQNLYHALLLLVLYRKHLLKGNQVFVLLLRKVDFEAGQLDGKQLLSGLLFALVGEFEVHIVDERKNSLFEWLLA
jgi:hypothetical protein